MGYLPGKELFGAHLGMGSTCEAKKFNEQASGLVFKLILKEISAAGV